MKDNKELKVTWIIFEAYADYITNLYKSSGTEMNRTIKNMFYLVDVFKKNGETNDKKMSFIANAVIVAYLLTKDRFEDVKSFDWFCHQVLSGFRDLKLEKMIDD
jgi:hypothetical protein